MNFHQWLEDQQTREDTVGALARQLLQDPISPLWSDRLSTYQSFLIYRDAQSSFATLTAAFGEWQCVRDRKSPPIMLEQTRKLDKEMTTARLSHA